jgi:hypothetical protein
MEWQLSSSPLTALQALYITLANRGDDYVAGSVVVGLVNALERHMLHLGRCEQSAAPLLRRRCT